MTYPDFAYTVKRILGNPSKSLDYNPYHWWWGRWHNTSSNSDSRIAQLWPILLNSAVYIGITPIACTDIQNFLLTETLMVASPIACTVVREPPKSRACRLEFCLKSPVYQGIRGFHPGQMTKTDNSRAPHLLPILCRYSRKILGLASN